MEKEIEILKTKGIIKRVKSNKNDIGDKEIEFKLKNNS